MEEHHDQRALNQDQHIVLNAQHESQKDALQTVAILPVFMLLCYLALIFYFRTKGGYRVVDLEREKSAAAT